VQNRALVESTGRMWRWRQDASTIGRAYAERETVSQGISEGSGWVSPKSGCRDVMRARRLWPQEGAAGIFRATQEFPQSGNFSGNICKSGRPMLRLFSARHQFGRCPKSERFSLVQGKKQGRIQIVGARAIAALLPDFALCPLHGSRLAALPRGAAGRGLLPPALRTGEENFERTFCRGETRRQRFSLVQGKKQGRI
jgi:hypothetical protein